MEINGETPESVQLMNNLQSSLSKKTESQNNSISIYKDSTITIEAQIKAVKMMKSAFPALPAGFYDILIDRMRANNFSDDRMLDSIGNCIDTCVYPTPTIANLISWDKRVKLYTYQEVGVMVTEKGFKMSDFAIKEVNGCMFRVLRSEATQYGIF